MCEVIVLTDWIMIAITFVYVVATILICIFNYKSAQATRDQVAEAKRQFEESNRAFITVTFVIIRSGLAVLLIKNHGNRIAHNVNIKVDAAFLNNVPDTMDRDNLEKLARSAFVVGIGQSWYCCMGSSIELSQLAEKLMHIDLSYNDSSEKYIESIDINLEEYFWSLIYDSPLEDLYAESKKITKSIQGMENISNKMLLSQQEIQKAISKIEISNPTKK